MDHFAIAPEPEFPPAWMMDMDAEMPNFAPGYDSPLNQLVLRLELEDLERRRLQQLGRQAQGPRPDAGPDAQLAPPRQLAALAAARVRAHALP